MRWLVAFALLVASLCGEAASGLREERFAFSCPMDGRLFETMRSHCS